MVDIIQATTSGELIITGEKGIETLRAGKAANIDKKTIEAVFEFIEKNPSKIAEDAKLRTALTSVADQFHGFGLKAEKAQQLIDALNFKIDALNFKKGEKALNATVELIKNPLARKLLTDKELQVMGIEDVAKLDKYIEAKGKFAEFAKDVKANEASIRSTMIEHSNVHPKVAEAMVDKHANKFGRISADIRNGMAKAEEVIAKTLKEVVQTDKKIALLGDKGKDTKALEELRAKQVQRIVDATSGKGFEGAFFEHIKDKNPQLYEALVGADAKLASHVETSIKNGVSGAAKQGGNKWYSIFKGQDALVETAKKEGVAVEKLGFLKKIRPGKTAAIAGIAAVGAAYLASTGNKGPSERAESASRGREGQAAGVGVA